MNTSSKIYVVILILIMGWLGYKIFQSAKKSGNESPAGHSNYAVQQEDKVAKEQTHESEKTTSFVEKNTRTIGTYKYFQLHVYDDQFKIAVLDTIHKKTINFIHFDGHFDTLLIADLLPMPEAELILLTQTGGSGGMYQICEIYTTAFDSGKVFSVFRLVGGLEEFDIPKIDEEFSELTIFGRTFVWNGEQFVEKNQFKKIDEIEGKVQLFMDSNANKAKLSFSNGQEVTFPAESDTKFRFVTLDGQIFLIMFTGGISEIMNEAHQYRMEIFKIINGNIQKLFSRVVAHDIQEFTEGFQCYFSSKEGKTYIYFVSVSKLDPVFSPLVLSQNQKEPENIAFTYKLENNSFVLEEHIQWLTPEGPGVVFGLKPDSVKVYDTPQSLRVIYRFPACDKLYIDDLSPEPGPEALLFSYEPGYKWGFDYIFDVYNLETGKKLASYRSDRKPVALFTPPSPSHISEWLLLFPDTWKPFALVHDTTQFKYHSKLTFKPKRIN